jgi:hemerythrin
MLLLCKMDESLYYAKEELKRVDHLIFVSLKYTRTCDVMQSIIERLIECYNHVFEAYLKKLKDEKKIDKIPKLPAQKTVSLKEHFPNHEELLKNIEFYQLLRRMKNADEISRCSEFRRNVTMIVHLDDEAYEVTIDSITEYYKNTQEFVETISKELIEE